MIAYAPGFPWQTFLDAQQLGDRQQVVLAELTTMRDLAKLYEHTPVPTLKAFLTFHYLSKHNAAYLPKRFDEAHFAFYGQTMRGQPQQKSRWKRAVSAIDGSIGEPVGRLYVAEYFRPQSKAKMQALVGNLLAALSQRIDALEWMSPMTKTRAHEKLATFIVKVGYPDHWKDYSAAGHQARRSGRQPAACRTVVVGLPGGAHRQAGGSHRVGHTPQRSTPTTTRSTRSSFLRRSCSRPSSIRTPTTPVDYGAIGAVIGHEISHGFDDQGRNFGPDGAMSDWWMARGCEVFEPRKDMLVKEFSAFEALPGLNVNGANTIGENIGDLGGLNIATRPT